MATTKRSKNSAAKNKSIDRPFDLAILRRAKAIATKYQVIVRFDDEEKEYYGRGLELPLAMGNGQTPDQCVDSTRQAFVAVVATMLERGEPVPAPATEGVRTEQTNIRLSVEEKLLLEQRASKNGFKGISDYIRATVLSR
jgi:predicted RNase H-like HicB family nuclease